MRWYFFIVGVCGMPFTGGWSFLIGVLMFLFITIGGNHHAVSIQSIKQSKTPVHTVGIGCFSLVITLGIGIVFLLVILMVGIVMLER